MCTAEEETRAATQEERKYVSRVGAVGKGAPKVALISIQAACKVLREFGMPADLTEAVTALQTAPALTEQALGKLPVPIQQAVMHDVTGHDDAGTALVLYQQQQPLPVSLPECSIPNNKMKKHYSLPLPHRDKEPLKSELKALQAWATARF